MNYTYEYPRPAVAVDLLVFRMNNGQQQLLLIRRKNEPFRNSWALPGGFLDHEETLEAAAARELVEETGVKLDSAILRQLKAYSAVDRDPRTRVISVVYLAVIKGDQPVTAGDDAADADWFSTSALPELAFDHHEIIQDGLRSLRKNG